MSNTNNIIPIASDHGGFWIKEFIKTQLTDAGFEVKDFERRRLCTWNYCLWKRSGSRDDGQ